MRRPGLTRLTRTCRAGVRLLTTTTAGGLGLTTRKEETLNYLSLVLFRKPTCDYCCENPELCDERFLITADPRLTDGVTV